MRGHPDLMEPKRTRMHLQVQAAIPQRRSAAWRGLFLVTCRKLELWPRGRVRSDDNTQVDPPDDEH